MQAHYRNSFKGVYAMQNEAKNLKKDQKVKFDNESYYYTVRAVRHPFVICTLKLFGENYYTILNTETNVRGSGSNCAFCHRTDLEIAESMLALHGEDPNGFEQEISSRNSVPISISDVVDPVKKG